MRLCSLVIAMVGLVSAEVFASCSGKVINPATDICWSCVFPIKIGHGTNLKKGELPDPTTDAKALCSCGKGADLKVGFNFSFWEPVRTVEVVRESGCSPSLGGQSLKIAQAPSHVKVGGHFNTKRHTQFWQVHWYSTPWLFLLEALLDDNCIEKAPWDLVYLSELDPLWNDNLASFVLQPDAALFANPIGVASCAVDCVSASLGLPNNALYWCSGCKGSLFPLTGWVASSTSAVDAWLLLTHRFATKMARQGLLWSAHGREGQCAPYIQPLLRKDVWRTEVLLPTGFHQKTKPCCAPLGRTSAVSESGRIVSPGAEDGAVLLWRRRDCCSTARMMINE